MKSLRLTAVLLASTLVAGSAFAQAVQTAPVAPTAPVTAPKPVVPAAPAAPAAPVAPKVVAPVAPAAQTPAVAPKAAAPAAVVAPANKMARVNLNTASEAELDKLPQIGPARAKAIIDARAKGRFKSWDDFVARNVVPGNAEAAIKDQVSF